MLKGFVTRQRQLLPYALNAGIPFKLVFLLTMQSSGKKIRVFSSFQEQEDEMIDYWASITPLKRLEHLHEMVIASFGLTEGKIKNPQLGRSLKIIFYKP